jgi:hypothetical protein
MHVNYDCRYYYGGILYNSLNWQTLNVDFDISSTNNPPTVQISSPLNGAIVSGGINIQGTASDSDGSITQVEVKIDSGSWETCSGTTSWSKNWDTTTVGTGAHTIRARSRDDDGAYSSVDTITVNVDNGGNNPPTVHIIQPSNGATLSEEITIQGTASDSDGSVAQVEVRIDDGSWWTATGTTSWSTSWNTNTVNDGSHTIYTRSKDNDDAYSPWSYIIVTVNNDGTNQPPIKPSLTGTTKGKAGNVYTYSATTTDPDGDKVYYWFDWGDNTNSGWKGSHNSGETCDVSHVWQTQGSYTIKVKARDTGGLESDWATLSVSMPKSKPYTDRPFPGFLQSILERFPLLARLFQPVFNRLLDLI